MSLHLKQCILFSIFVTIKKREQLIEYIHGNCKKSHLPSDIDLEYKKFCLELIQREKNGEVIDYEKESIRFWNQKLKEAIKDHKSN